MTSGTPLQPVLHVILDVAYQDLSHKQLLHIGFLGASMKVLQARPGKFEQGRAVVVARRLI
jgi:hypothetical protein